MDQLEQHFRNLFTSKMTMICLKQQLQGWCGNAAYRPGSVYLHTHTHTCGWL